MDHPVSSALASPEKEEKPLTSEDVQLLKNSATLLNRHAEEIGVQIVEMIFNQDPHVKQLFSFMQSSDETKQREKMNIFAKKYVQALASYVMTVDDTERNEKISDDIVQRHLTIDQFQLQNRWAVFTESTIFFFRKFVEDDEAFKDVEILDRTVMLWRMVLREIKLKIEEALPSDPSMTSAKDG
ncbi:hypothetical protein Q1695_007822 [Nippostrongylus brasiliensis]|nr:hypothetical protein Q1695_007822 [Nippostrongylus brasiliensis]